MVNLERVAIACMVGADLCVCPGWTFGESPGQTCVSAPAGLSGNRQGRPVCLPRLDFRGIARADLCVCPYTDLQTDLIRNPQSAIKGRSEHSPCSATVASRRYQYSIRSANWISRADRAELTVPKAVRAGSGVRCGVSRSGEIAMLGKL